MEQPPKPEAGKEKVEKAKVIELLKTKGFEDPEAREAVMQWTLQREEEVTLENTSRAAIVFNIERADLYVAAGDYDGALECLLSAQEQARYENEEELFAEIQDKIDRFD